LKTGKINTLIIAREEKQGYYLKAKDGELEVLLPWNSQVGEPKIDDEVEVFIYRDSEDRLIASQEMPLAFEGDFAALEVIQNGTGGTFMNWGLLKDLIVPRSEQRKPMNVGEVHVVKICVDPQTDRLFGSAQIDFFLTEADEDLPLNEPIGAIVYDKSPIGFSCIVDNKYSGMLYHNQIFQTLKVGQSITVYPQTVREDGKLDLLARKAGYLGHIDSDTEAILFYMKQNDGKMPYNDKTSPEEISEIFRMSKKQFKKALGALYKKKQIRFETDYTLLLAN